MLYLLFRSLSVAAAFFLSGIFIDLDHILEYAHAFGVKGFSARKFFRAAHNHEYRQYFLLVHSWEIAFLLWAAAVLLLPYPWAVGFALGFTLHILADQLYNPCAPLTYFLWFRIRHRFDGDILFPPEKRAKKSRRRF
ncbi:MAG: hypothetical protein NTV79_11995 [Candidatus Aureabacteria bacterium]|nr:hypothetical protein [Candidatus Auribacterota bacterium]